MVAASCAVVIVPELPGKNSREKILLRSPDGRIKNPVFSPARVRAIDVLEISECAVRAAS